MNSSSNKNALRLSVLIIGITWIWQILYLFFPQEPFMNFFLPKINIIDNLPAASLYVMGKGIGYFLLVLWLLRSTQENFSALGFHKDHLLKSISIGASFGLLIFIFHSALLLPVIDSLLPKSHVSNSGLFSTNLNIVILLFLGVVKGGFLEELWRIFVITRFEKLFSRAGLVSAFVISSIVFGLGHAYQGNNAIIGTAVIGSMNGLVYLRKRSAIEAVTAHALFDVLAVAGGALISSGHVK